MPRRDYGTYIRQLLDQELERCAGSQGRLDLVPGEVTALSVQDDQAVLSLSSGRDISADIAVLATGNVPALPPPVADRGFYDTPFYAPDPWARTPWRSCTPTRRSC